MNHEGYKDYTAERAIEAVYREQTNYFQERKQKRRKRRREKDSKKNKKVTD